MLKGLGNLATLMKQAQEMQDKLAEIQVEGNAGGGMVTVTATGQQKVTGIQIEPSLLQAEEKEMLEDLLVAAMNQAFDKAKEAAANEMGQLTGDLNIPGLNDTLSKFGLGN